MRRHRSGLYLAALTLGFFWFLYGLSISSRSPKYLNLSAHHTDAHTTEANRGYGRNLSTKSGSAVHSSLRVLYNRVPKCGSRSALTLFKSLSVKNGFEVINPKKNSPYVLNVQDQKQISDLISSLKPPLLYHRHVHFMDFASLGGPSVTYINLIRDPLSRAVSHFYFRRHGDGILGKSRVEKPINTVETFDECVLKGNGECTGNWVKFFIVPFFCGHTHECRAATRWALEEAKRRVVKDYLVVGVVEEFDDFVKVLETLLPSFFRGAYAKWKSPGTILHPKAVRSQTRNKKQPSKEVEAITKSRMYLEYEFYEFVKERFHALKRELDI